MLFILSFIFLGVQSAEECTYQSNLITIDTDVSMDDIKDPNRPTFIRLTSPGCPYSPPSQKQWEKAASLYPQVNFVTVDSWKNEKITKLFSNTVTPVHALFKANMATFSEDAVIGNTADIQTSPQRFLQVISQITNLYPIAPPLVSLSPMIIDSFYTSVDDPIILLYDSRCSDQVSFLNEWARVANEVIFSNGENPRIGMLDCSIYPDECQRWSHPYNSKTPRALIYSSKTGNFDVLDTINNINSGKIDGLYANALSRPSRPTPSPIPIPDQSFNVPSTDGYELLENTALRDSKSIDNLKQEYKNVFVSPSSACETASECEAKTLNVPGECPQINNSPEDHSQALKVINFFRKLAGLSDNIIKEETWSEECYKTAINMHKIGRVPSDHIIKENYATSQYCGELNNVQVSKDSLLSENAKSVFESSYKLFLDEGEHNNGLVGHRRYLLHPNLNKIGMGFYPYKEDQFDGYSLMRPAVTVIRVTKDNSLTYVEDVELQNIKFISWPPEGPFPLNQLPSNWHITHKDFGTANIDDLKIYVQRDDNIELKVKKANIVKQSIYSHSLVLQMTEEALKRCQLLRTITVTIFNERLKKVYRFSFELFDDKEVTDVCLYSTDATKCQSFEKAYGPNQYQQSIFTSSTNPVKVHVVEPINLKENKISFTASTKFFLIGEQIDGTIEIGSSTTLDVQNPSKTSYEVNWKINEKKIGVIETALAAKSVFIKIQDENEQISIYDLTFYTGRQTKLGLSKLIYTGVDNDIYFSIGGVDENFFVMASTSPAYQEYSCSSDSEYDKPSIIHVNDVHQMIHQSTNKRVIKFYISEVSDVDPIDLRSFIPGRKRDYQFIVVGGKVYFSCDMNISKVANSITFSASEDNKNYIFECRKAPFNQNDKRNVCPMDFITINGASFQGDSGGVVILPYIKGDQSAINYNDLAQFNDLYPKEGDEDSGVINAINAGYGPKTRCIITTSGTHSSYRINYDSEKPQKTYSPFVFRPAAGTEEKPVTLSFYEITLGKRPQGPKDFDFYFENYKDLTLDMPAVMKYNYDKKVYSYLNQYKFDNCGKVAFIGNDETTPKDPFEIEETLVLGNFNYGVIIVSPLVLVTGSDSYDGTWVHAKKLSVAANMRPTINNLTIKESISIDSSTVIFDKCTIEKNTVFDIKKTEDWWPSISLNDSPIEPQSISIDLGITTRLLDSSEEYESHSLITGINKNKCESIKSISQIKNNGKFSLECSSDKTELLVVKGKENAPILSPEGGENTPPEQPNVTPEQPIVTPEPIIPSRPADIVEKLDNPNDLNTAEKLDTSLSEKFEQIESSLTESNQDAHKVVVIENINDIPFNSELKNDQFIKPPKDSTVNYNGGSLHIVIPENVNVVLSNPQESNLMIKGEGTVNIKVKEGSTDSIKLNTKSHINGSVTITVPKEVSTFSLDSIELDSKGQLSVKKEGSDASKEKVTLKVREISTTPNTNAKISDLTIESSLNIIQTAVLNVDNVNLKDAKINYDIFEYEKLDKVFFTGKFTTIPKALTFSNKGNSNSKPPKKVEYSIISGTFDGISCSDWYPKIDFSNSGFNKKVCKDIEQQSQQLDSENKRIVIQFDPKSGGKLGPGPIVGIVVAVIVVIAVIVVVVVVVIKRKKNLQNSSDNEDVANIEKNEV